MWGGVWEVGLGGGGGDVGAFLSVSKVTGKINNI